MPIMALVMALGRWLRLALWEHVFPPTLIHHQTPSAALLVAHELPTRFPIIHAPPPDPNR
jgi:hypothetical protein